MHQVPTLFLKKMEPSLRSTRSHVTQIISAFVTLALLTSSLAECRLMGNPGGMKYLSTYCRKHTALLTAFGAKGDGITLNTKAFQDAITSLGKLGLDGGAQLIVPPGRWLTGAFNLTSHFTLYLEEGAVILGSQEESDYPIFPPLPSYGKGRDATDGRFGSLIFGTNLSDVVITGANGTIDGQGALWWSKFKENSLKHTRPYLLELMYSNEILISNVTFLNSPSWNVHPVYCSDIIIQDVTILAPTKSPNTDGINPDSCTNTKLQDIYIVSGDDCVAVKSGWDQYGIRVGMPTKQLIIRRLTCISPFSALLALGSELSGGIEDVRTEDLTAINTESALRIKTAPGRGAYVKDIYMKGLTLKTMKYVLWMAGTYGQHPDNGFDPRAYTTVTNINFRDVVAENVTMSANMAGIDPKHQFTGICLSNVTMKLSPEPKKLQWNCTDVRGISTNVRPTPCAELTPNGAPAPCGYPLNKLPIDNVKLQTCML